MNRFDFSILKFTPDSQRGEVMNVGILIYLANGVDIRILQSVSKLKAFDSHLNLNVLNEFVSDLEWVAKGISNPEKLHQIFQGQFSISKPGYFTVSEMSDYEIKANSLMDKFVNPIKSKRKAGNKRLVTNIKEEFQKQGILGSSIDDISNHKVVTSYPIAENEGLFAEFLLKNGSYHLTETLDLRTEQHRAKLGESALKALTIDKAKDVFQGNLKSFVIFAAENASQERNAKHQLNILGEHTDNMFNLCSKQDMAAYYEHMISAASGYNHH
ncbi:MULTISPECIES: DUF3037 domain-containing protein [Vibrio]|uniref:DUF3037 domain-containing protein n=1 Tax=Vibrio aestuarianus TaxID=28171 RepID=A0A9X4FJW6_9VIBR|nr:DUF3037 domain-containing protein [Vibrio aestuarianus]MDE1358784.1 DUF3037 domain-containing protein [Vibrio aestuarianus]